MVAEMENSSLSAVSLITSAMIVDFPQPEGAERIIILPFFITKEINEMKKLHHIEHLLLDLLKFVFHFHDDALHLGMV